MKKWVSSTTERVPQHTCEKINKRIRACTVCRIHLLQNSSEEELTDRIRELDEEWDTERVLEANAGMLVTTASLAGYMKSKCPCFLFTGAVGYCLLQHAVQGWCPSIPFIRRAGIRTAKEIQDEKTVMKLMRGDFMQGIGNPDEMLRMAEM
ncbi:MAG: DUF2892 domain-containing protein [Thermocaproicibacter melissae]|jgi:hypothetical protein|uniref:YgaP family membrane protein n=1 Tax=Thermocaproicibacter melissae TaxID=2966552 RepID=UPI003A0FE0CD